MTFLHSLRRMSWHFIVLLLGNVPGIPDSLRAEYLKLALSSLTKRDPMHRDIGAILNHINALKA